MTLILKSVLFFLGFLLLFSCRVQQTVAGKYTIIQRGKYPKIIPVTFYVELNGDSTFSYNYRGGFYGEISTGFWETDKDNKRVIMTSFIQDIHNIPIVVTETRNNDHSSPLFIFNNPLKLDASVKWELNVNDTDYPINTDRLMLDKEIVVESFYLTGHVALEDSTYRTPIPLQDTIQSEKYYIKNPNNNIYYISFPTFVNYDVFHYKPLQDSLKLNGNTLLFEGIKLKKKN